MNPNRYPHNLILALGAALAVAGLAVSPPPGAAAPVVPQAKSKGSAKPPPAAGKAHEQVSKGLHYDDQTGRNDERRHKAHLAAAGSRYRRQPHSERAALDYGIALLENRQYKEAKELSARARKDHPDWQSIYIINGIIALVELDDDRALKCFNRVLAARPDEPLALHLRFEQYRNRGKYSLALADLNHMLSLLTPAQKEERSRLLLARARIYKVDKQYARCIQDTKELQKLFPESTTGLREQLEANYELANYDAVIADANDLLARAPTVGITRVFRAKAYAARKNYKAAIKDLNVHLEHLDRDRKLLPNNQELILLRASLYDKIGRKDLGDADRNWLKKELKEAYKDAWFRTRGK